MSNLQTYRATTIRDLKLTNWEIEKIGYNSRTVWKSFYWISLLVHQDKPDQIQSGVRFLVVLGKYSPVRPIDMSCEFWLSTKMLKGFCYRSVYQVFSFQTRSVRWRLQAWNPGLWTPGLFTRRVLDTFCGFKITFSSTISSACITVRDLCSDP